MRREKRGAAICRGSVRCIALSAVRGTDVLLDELESVLDKLMGIRHLRVEMDNDVEGVTH